MSDCRFGVSPVNYPDPDPEQFCWNESDAISKGKQENIFAKLTSFSLQEAFKIPILSLQIDYFCIFNGGRNIVLEQKC